jgi:hypothetical protein
MLVSAASCPGRSLSLVQTGTSSIIFCFSFFVNPVNMLEISPTIAVSYIVIFHTIAITATVIIILFRHLDSTLCSFVIDSVDLDIGKQ